MAEAEYMSRQTSGRSMSVILPTILAVEKEGASKVRLKISLPEDLLYFQGHFPDAPILPGIVQTDWPSVLVARISR